MLPYYFYISYYYLYVLRANHVFFAYNVWHDASCAGGHMSYLSTYTSMCCLIYIQFNFNFTLFYLFIFLVFIYLLFIYLLTYLFLILYFIYYFDFSYLLYLFIYIFSYLFTIYLFVYAYGPLARAYSLRIT